MMKDEVAFSAMIWVLYVKFLASSPTSEIPSHGLHCRVSNGFVAHWSIPRLSHGTIRQARPFRLYHSSLLS